MKTVRVVDSAEQYFQEINSDSPLAETQTLRVHSLLCRTVRDLLAQISAKSLMRLQVQQTGSGSRPTSQPFNYNHVGYEDPFHVQLTEDLPQTEISSFSHITECKKPIMHNVFKYVYFVDYAKYIKPLFTG